LSAKVLQFTPRPPAQADVLADLAFEMWLAHCFYAERSPAQDLAEAEKALRLSNPGKLLVLPKTATR
jgi:hypothetical protein